jgi:ribose 5-phosphate isomerase A
MVSTMDEVAKRSAARAAAELVKPGMRIGLGTGSSFGFALERLGERMSEEGLEVIGVPSSQATQRLAEKLGMPLLDPGDVDALDLAIDGADEVDPARNLTKGGGGALLRERIVAALATELVVVIGDNKLVQKLGTTFALPVEVLPFGWRQAKRAIAELGCEPELRHRRDQPFRTDNDNFVLDCRFPGIDDPAALYRDLNCIPGVLDNGLFVGMAGRVYVGNAQGEVTVLD